MFVDRINVAILPKLVYRFNANPIKIPAGVCVETDKLSLKFIQNNFAKKMEEGHSFSNYYKLQ